MPPPGSLPSGYQHPALAPRIYRFDGHRRLIPSDYADATHLLATLAASVAGTRTDRWTDTAASGSRAHTYVVRAVDALGDESTPAVAYR